MVDNQAFEQAKNIVKQQADIVQIIGECVDLKKAGARFTGLCPFHAEKTPSFSVNPQHQFFHCFGCGASGDVFSFVMQYHHLSFLEALKSLAEQYNVELPKRKMSAADRHQVEEREQLYAFNEQAASLYQRYLREGAASRSARDYLKERGVSDELALEYGLGFAPHQDQEGWHFIQDALGQDTSAVKALIKTGLVVKNDQGRSYDRFRSRLMFPIIDLSGRVAAFGGRIIGEGTPKYMNSPESRIFDKSRILFGLYQHRDTIRQRRQALLVEGNFDLLLLAGFGINNVVAPLGTALSRQHVAMLRGYCDEVIILFDGDTAGVKAAMRAVPLFLAEQVESRVALLPDGHDPDSYVRKFGPDGIDHLVEQAVPLAEFVVEQLIAEHGLTLSGKSRIIHTLQETLSQAGDARQRSLMVDHFSQALGVSRGQFTAVQKPSPYISASTYTQPQTSQTQPKRETNTSKIKIKKGNDTQEVQPETMKLRSFASLPQKDRQLANFLLLYPHYLQEVEAAGVRNLVSEPVLILLLDTLQHLHETERATVEHLFASLADLAIPQAQGYLANLLAQEEDTGSEEERIAYEKDVCANLCGWISSSVQRKSVPSLIEQIKQAERNGDIKTLMTLLQKQQEIGRQQFS